MLRKCSIPHYGVVESKLRISLETVKYDNTELSQVNIHSSSD